MVPRWMPGPEGEGKQNSSAGGAKSFSHVIFIGSKIKKLLAENDMNETGAFDDAQMGRDAVYVIHND